MTVRKITTLVTAVCAATVIGAGAASAQQTVIGGGVAFTDADWVDFGFQVNAYVPIGAVPGLRVGGDFTYYLPQDDINFFAINGNAQYYFMSTPELALYGLAGISFSRISIDIDLGNDFFDVSGSDTDIGVNIGIGLEYPVGFGALYGEAKVVTGTYDRIGLAGGVRIPIN